MDWKAYQESTVGREARPLLARALSYVSSKHAALDLGAGAFRDTQALIDAGFERIVALDQRFHVPLPSQPKLEIVETKIEQYTFPENTFNLISAQYSLPFIPQFDFGTTWQRILQSLTRGGVITAQFFGERDGWARNGEVTCFSRKEIDAHLSTLEVIELSEEEYDEPTVTGEQKHWHVFSVIARKPASTVT